jgi:hypothetical protein
MAVLENLGFIKKAALFPCPDANAVLIIEAAGKAIAPVLLAAGTWGCLDIIRMRLGKAPWHIRALRNFIEGVVQPAEADKINKIYKFLIPVEKALFFWFVVDLTTEFLARWESQVFKLGGCGAPADECHFQGENPSWVSTGGDVMTPVSYFPTHIEGDCHSTDGSGWQVREGGFWQAFFSITPRPVFEGVPASSLSMTIIEELSGFQYPVQEVVPPWFGNNMTGIYSASGQNKQRRTHQYRFYASSRDIAVAQSGSCAISLSDMPMFNKGIIPVNCLGGILPSHEILL